MVPVGETGVRLGQYNHRALWLDSEIDAVLMLRDSGLSYGEIARRMDMPKSTVWAVCSGLLRGKMPAGWKRRNV